MKTMFKLNNMEIDNTLKDNLIADVENICNTALTDETIEALKRAFEVTLVLHSIQPLPDKEGKSAEEIHSFLQNYLIINEDGTPYLSLKGVELVFAQFQSPIQTDKKVRYEIPRKPTRDAFLTEDIVVDA